MGWTGSRSRRRRDGWKNGRTGRRAGAPSISNEEIMGKIAYRDIYGFDDIFEAARKLGAGGDDPEEWAHDLHNDLVWKRYRPRDDAERDEVVGAVIGKACLERGIRPEQAADPCVAALVRALDL